MCGIAGIVASSDNISERLLGSIKSLGISWVRLVRNGGDQWYASAPQIRKNIGAVDEVNERERIWLNYPEMWG